MPSFTISLPLYKDALYAFSIYFFMSPMNISICFELIFVLLVEMEFHHIVQAGLKLLISGDLPASASQVLEL